jgi:excisionase family DNA binding protein
MTLLDVARLLKVAEKTVYTMSQKAQLPAFKVRGQWRFKRIDLEGRSSSRRQTLETRKGAEMPPSRGRNSLKSLAAGLSLSLAPRRIRELG